MQHSSLPGMDRSKTARLAQDENVARFVRRTLEQARPCRAWIAPVPIEATSLRSGIATGEAAWPFGCAARKRAWRERRAPARQRVAVLTLSCSDGDHHNSRGPSTHRSPSSPSSSPHSPRSSGLSRSRAPKARRRSPCGKYKVVPAARTGSSWPKGQGYPGRVKLVTMSSSGSAGGASAF